jgi:hypothetical protein
MAISYTNPAEKVIIREPLAKRFRSFYRTPRKSTPQNLYAQQIYMDIKRVYLALELTSVQILNKVKIFLGQENDETHVTGQYLIKNNTGTLYDVYGYSRYYDLTQDSIEFYDFVNQKTIVQLDTLDSIGGRLSNILYKINKIEKQLQ